MVKALPVILTELIHNPAFGNHCSRMTNCWSCICFWGPSQFRKRINLNHIRVTYKPWTNSLSGVYKRLLNTQCEINFSLSGGKHGFPNCTAQFTPHGSTLLTDIFHISQWTNKVVGMFSGNIRNLGPNTYLCYVIFYWCPEKDCPLQLPQWYCFLIRWGNCQVFLLQEQLQNKWTTPLLWSNSYYGQNPLWPTLYPTHPSKGKRWKVLVANFGSPETSTS